MELSGSENMVPSSQDLLGVDRDQAALLMG